MGDSEEQWEGGKKEHLQYATIKKKNSFFFSHHTKFVIDSAPGPQEIQSYLVMKRQRGKRQFQLYDKTAQRQLKKSKVFSVSSVLLRYWINSAQLCPLLYSPHLLINAVFTGNRWISGGIVNSCLTPANQCLYCVWVWINIYFSVFYEILKSVIIAHLQKSQLNRLAFWTKVYSQWEPSYWCSDQFDGKGIFMNVTFYAQQEDCVFLHLYSSSYCLAT